MLSAPPRPTVKKGEPGRHYELFGLDMMLDRSGKVWLLEGNNSVGIEYCGSHIPEKGQEVKEGEKWKDYVPAPGVAPPHFGAGGAAPGWLRRRAASAAFADHFSDEVLKQVVHDTYSLLGVDAAGGNGWEEAARSP
eukprot:gene3805-6048_t